MSLGEFHPFSWPGESHIAQFTHCKARPWQNPTCPPPPAPAGWGSPTAGFCPVPSPSSVCSTGARLDSTMKVRQHSQLDPFEITSRLESWVLSGCHTLRIVRVRNIPVAWRARGVFWWRRCWSSSPACIPTRWWKRLRTETERRVPPEWNVLPRLLVRRNPLFSQTGQTGISEESSEQVWLGFLAIRQRTLWYFWLWTERKSVFLVFNAFGRSASKCRNLAVYLSRNEKAVFTNLGVSAPDNKTRCSIWRDRLSFWISVCIAEVVWPTSALLHLVLLPSEVSGVIIDDGVDVSVDLLADSWIIVAVCIYGRHLWKEIRTIARRVNKILWLNKNTLRV